MSQHTQEINALLQYAVANDSSQLTALKMKPIYILPRVMFYLRRLNLTYQDDEFTKVINRLRDYSAVMRANQTYCPIQYCRRRFIDKEYTLEFMFSPLDTPGRILLNHPMFGNFQLPVKFTTNMKFLDAIDKEERIYYDLKMCTLTQSQEKNIHFWKNLINLPPNPRPVHMWERKCIIKAMIADLATSSYDQNSDNAVDIFSDDE